MEVITLIRRTSYRFQVLDELAIPRALRQTDFWPEWDNEQFPMLRWADEYSLTYFSSYQMRGLIPELELLRSQKSSQLAIQTMDEVMRMAKDCRNGVHEYLVLLGE